jgi:hypothetical protein
VSHFRGQVAQAKSLFDEALTVLRRDAFKQWMPGTLAGLAGVAATEGHLEHAARLLAAAQSLVAALDAEWEPEERAEYERHLAAVRAALGDDRFAAAWEKGCALSLEEAIDLALAGS